VTQTKIHFGIGLFIGIIATALFFQFFALRYEVMESGKMLIKQDKWSGTSWKFEGNKWEKITSVLKDWKPVDKILMEALNITIHGDKKNSSYNQIASLKKKHPELEKISSEDIMERIKYIYARQIMVDLYFSNANVE